MRRAGGKLREPRVAASVIGPCLDAVAFLHARGVAHRDIKPENILLCRDAHGEHMVKLADFGLSIDASLERPVTRAGTLDYMSPEVVRCPEKCGPLDNKDRPDLEYGPSVDVWALGVLAYELVVGRPPFEAESRGDTCDLIARAAPRFPSSASPGLKAYVLASCAKQAAKRPCAAGLRGHPWVAGAAARASGGAGAAGGAAKAGAPRASSEGVAGAVLHWAGAAGKTLTRLLTPGGGRAGGASADAAVVAAPSQPRAPAVVGRPPLAPSMSGALSGALSSGSAGSAPAPAPAAAASPLAADAIKAWHGASPPPPALPAIPASPWAAASRSQSGRLDASPAPRVAVGGLAAWRARRAAASGSLAAAASATSADLCDTPAPARGVAFPSGRTSPAKAAGPPAAKRSLSASMHAASAQGQQWGQ